MHGLILLKVGWVGNIPKEKFWLSFWLSLLAGTCVVYVQGFIRRLSHAIWEGVNLLKFLSWHVCPCFCFFVRIGAVKNL